VVTDTIDEVHITFSELLDVSSICSTWSGTGNQTLSGSGVVVTITENGANDTLTVTSSGCTLHICSVATGANYVTTTSTFSGFFFGSRVTWTESTRLLTIHLGAITSGSLNSVAQPATTVTYTPNSAIADVAGNLVNTTPFAATNQRF
jgi:hypothetical protein